MKFLINRRITISMIFLAITMLGIISYRQLSMELLPNAEYPTISVNVNSRTEVDPSYMESEVVMAIEGAIKTVEGIQYLNSDIGSSSARLTVNFKESVNLKYASIKVQEKIKEISKNLPEGFTVNVQKGGATGVQNSFMTLQIRGTGGVDRVRSIADEKITEHLENIDGVASVNVFGGREKSIEILLDKQSALARNLTTSSISQIISQNTQDRTFLGEVNSFNRKYYVHSEAAYSSPLELEDLVVGSGPTFLKDVAEIFYDLKEETSYNRVNGMEAISVTLNNEAQANIIEVAERTRKVIDKLNEELAPYDVIIAVASDNAQIMADNLNQIGWQALIGGLLAVIILWLFLRNIRLVMVIALSIPISVITAFNLFYAFGITINSLTLVGMALAIGMLLDNSVVVLENIYRMIATGEKPEVAVPKATGEVWRSILAATLTTITVFLPFIFSSNFLIKLIGYQIGVSIISTLGISLLVAFFFIPMAAYLIIKRQKKQDGFYKKISIRQRPVQIYMVLLKMTMRNTFTVFVCAVVVLFSVIMLSMTTTESSQKSAKSDRFMATFYMHQGVTLDKADSYVRTIEDRVKDIPELEDVICYVTSETANITFVLKEDYEKIGKRDMSEIQNDVRKLLWINNGQYWVSMSDAIGGGGGNQNNVVSGLSRMLSMLGIGYRGETIMITGKDQNLMRLVGEELQYIITQQDNIAYCQLGGTARRPELHLTLDQLLLNSYDISRNNITQSLTAFNAGTSSGAKLKIDDKEYDIVIKEKTDKIALMSDVTSEDENAGEVAAAPEIVTAEKTAEGEDGEVGTEEEAEEKYDVYDGTKLLLSEKELDIKELEDLRGLIIKNNNGGVHTLSEIASTRLANGPSWINRVNGEKRQFMWYGFNFGQDAPEDLIKASRSEIQDLIDAYPLPAGIAVELVEQEDTFADFRFLMIAAGLLIFMILASVFESLTMPFVLLFTIPLAAIGSLLALYLTSNSLTNINTLIGLLILLGVVVNNGIILIDYANILRKRGFGRVRALISAGLSRVRPILITSLTTIIALIPMAFGESEYSGLIGAPFAICVIGGLACSSLLTLIVIPSVYLGLENTLDWYRALPKKIMALHLVIMIVLIYIINTWVEGMLYQILYFVMAFIAVPGITYLCRTSLRSADKQIIPANKPITIRIENLVKIYDRPSLLEREWEGGIKLRRKLVPDSIWHNKYVEMLPYFLVPLIFIWRGGWESGSWFRFYFLAALIFTIRKISAYVYDNNIEVRNIEGKWSGLKRFIFSTATSIPLIGKRRRPFKALKGVSFEITNGMFGLLGPNGAGKSTFIRIISGILEQSYGTIWINDLNTRDHREALQGLIGYLPQEFGTYETMSAYDFLDYQAIVKGITDIGVRRQRLEYVLNAVHMWERKDDKINSFSGGMKQRIGIALILLHLPRILVVDEPTAGLDPRERIRFRNLLVELSKERIVIFSTHIIEDISSSCNQVVVINKGDLRYFGTPNEMLGFADSLVWSFTVTPEEFEEKLDMQYVVLHLQDGKNIQVRYIAETSPWPGAVRVEETLEDAYLCLLKNMKKKDYEESVNIISAINMSTIKTKKDKI